MSAENRDFSNFLLGDNVYELADGVIPRTAGQLGIELADEPNEEDLQRTMDQVGPKPELRTNPDISLTREQSVAAVEKSGVQKAINRSLWTPDVAADTDTVDAVVLMTGVANWSDRITDLAKTMPKGLPIYALGSNRKMKLATEQANPNIKGLHENFHRYPTEASYLGSVVTPKLVAAGHDVMMIPFATAVGDEIFEQFFAENPDLAESRLALLRVANAGIINVIQMRDAARKVNKDFDADPQHPQAFAVTDEFSVARTDEQEADPATYQKPETAIRQLFLAAKKIHIAGQSVRHGVQPRLDD